MRRHFGERMETGELLWSLLIWSKFPKLGDFLCNRCYELEEKVGGKIEN